MCQNLAPQRCDRIHNQTIYLGQIDEPKPKMDQTRTEGDAAKLRNVHDLQGNNYSSLLRRRITWANDGPQIAKVEGVSSVLANHINDLVEEYRKAVIKEFPGVRLIDFDNPAKYLYSMAATEQAKEATILFADLSELRNAIEQLINEEF